jgi:predicted dehydrogenase
MTAEQAASTNVFVGHCMRFWPGWCCLRDWLQAGRFGRLHSAFFKRVAARPGGAFYSDGKRTGGALLDLHIHDTDFVQYCFGSPKAVTSYGVELDNGTIDHVVTHYHYDDSAMILAEGAWFPSPAYKFSMSYRVCCQEATLVYTSELPNVVTVYTTNGEKFEERLTPEMGYDRELAYFIQCIEKGIRPQTVTLETAVEALRIVEAEHQSIETKSTVTL